VLDDNSIENEGALGIGEALKTNTTLKKLKLVGNQITTDGAIALAEALKTPESGVSYIDLSRD
jgi:hypothetical protein